MARSWRGGTGGVLGAKSGERPPVRKKLRSAYIRASLLRIGCISLAALRVLQGAKGAGMRDVDPAQSTVRLQALLIQPVHFGD